MKGRPAEIVGSLVLAASAIAVGFVANGSGGGSSESPVSLDNSQTTCDSQFCPIPTRTQIPIETLKPEAGETPGE